MRRRLDASSLALGLLTGLVFVLLYGPIAVPVVASFFRVAQGRIDWSSPTVDAYRLLRENASVLDALANTLIVGFCASFAALLLGMGLALFHGWRRARARQGLQVLVALPFLMPPIITGLALLIFFRETGVERSLVTVVIGHACFVLALVYRTILVRLDQLSASLVEASYDLGASSWQTFRLVLLPNLTSALVGAFVLAFALSFDETMISLLVTGTASTLPVRLWGMMRLGFTPDINALVTLILLFTTLLCLVAARSLFPAGGTEGRARG